MPIGLPKLTAKIEMEQNTRRRSSVMSEHMQQYPVSGLTQKAYCETHGINKSTFAYWLKKHRDQKKERAGGFVQVRPGGFESHTEIRYTNGVVVRFIGQVDARYLKELIG